MWDSNYQAPVVKVCGRSIEEEPGMRFAEAVKEHAREAGFSKFRVFVTQNGVETEIEADNAPETITEGMEISIKPYEKAA